MNQSTKVNRFITRMAGLAVLAGLVAGGALAQDKSRSDTNHGKPTYETEVKNAEVVYVEGNDLVVRNEDGRIEHLVVPDSDRFLVDGNEVTASDLMPGTKLTQTIVTTTTPRYVKTIRTLKGKVWHVNAPSTVVLRLPDNSNQIYSVPSHAKFTIEGKPKTVFDLRKGMSLEATIVTDSEETVVSSSKTTVAQLPAPATPREVGVLLFFHPKPVAMNLASTEQPAEMAQELPKTASAFPLAGAMGLLGLGLSMGLKTIRRRFKV